MTTFLHILTGQRMIERLTLRGHVVAAHASEPLIALVMVWWGIVLLPGWLEVTSIGVGGLDHVAPRPLWAAFAIVAGGVQVLGWLAAWLGLLAPVRSLRLVTLLLTVFWYTTLSGALASGGSTTGVATYAMLAVLTAINYRRAYLNGHGH